MAELRYLAMNPSRGGHSSYVWKGEQIDRDQARTIHEEWNAANPRPTYNQPQNYAVYTAACRVWVAKQKAETPKWTFFPDGTVTWHPFGAHGKVASLYDSEAKALRYGERAKVVDMDLLPFTTYEDANKEYEDYERLATEYMAKANEARRRAS